MADETATISDNTTEPTDLLLAPLPHAAGTATPLMPQAGVGVVACSVGSVVLSDMVAVSSAMASSL